MYTSCQLQCQLFFNHYYDITHTATFDIHFIVLKRTATCINVINLQLNIEVINPMRVQNSWPRQ